MNRQIDITQKLFGMSERAYIALDSVILITPIVKKDITINETHELLVNLTNGGKTPAHRLTVSYKVGRGVGWDDDESPIEFEDISQTLESKIALPGNTGFRFHQKHLTSDEIKHIALTLLKWYIQIEVTYWDVENIERSIDFTVVFHPETDGTFAIQNPLGGKFYSVNIAAPKENGNTDPQNPN